MNEKEASIYIALKLLEGERDLKKLKREASLKFNLKSFLKNSDVIKYAHDYLTSDLIQLLKRKASRTLSGVSPIAVMISPENSCNFSCIYCPSSSFAPKSYTGFEPATLRARQNNFDPFLQVKTRLEQYKLNAHPTFKCDIIVMGGTFFSKPKEYRETFIKRIYDALNDVNSNSLEEAKKINETSKHRAIGLTIETRPDKCGEEEINEMLYYGATRVELGVQNPSDEIYRIIKRGHSVNDVIRATALLKDSAFKVTYHLMLGLPGSDKKRDIEMFKLIFENPDFRPDMLKIYPTLVVENTELYEMYKNGKYIPYDDEDALEVLLEAYKYIPRYVRVMRIQRDIPSNLIVKGVVRSNLRERVESLLKERGEVIEEIRYREIGRKNLSLKDLELEKIIYDASNGKEIFLSFVDKSFDAIAAFLRLRIPFSPFRKEIDENSSLVRELHVYGEEVELGKKGRIQHQGLGSKLLREAETISKEEFDVKKILVISGVGAREYYYKHGYREDGPYVSKLI